MSPACNAPDREVFWIRDRVFFIASPGFIGLLEIGVDVTDAAVIAGLAIFLPRLLAIRFDLALPRFRFKA